jgi:L-ascorbate metabolism protein UlaG (beta-lactamase superfamily)
MRISRVQHTCFTVASGDTAMAIDPAIDYFNNLWSRHGRADRAIAMLSGSHAVLISHSHSDHFHLPTLLHFPRTVTVVLPAADAAAVRPMRDELLAFGFSAIVELADGESATIGSLTVTAVESPASIEGAAQTAYLVRDGATVVFHAADSLEFPAARVLGQAPDIDIALLPMNCSLNVANLRNQMSLATFAGMVTALSPQLVVPLGTNEGSRRPAGVLQAPWFPFDDSVLESPTVRGFMPKDTTLTPMRDGDVLDFPARKTSQYRYDANDPGATDSHVDVAAGRLWSLLTDVHLRARRDFGLQIDLGFQPWSERWHEAVERISALTAGAEDIVSDVIAQVPLPELRSPGTDCFRKTIRALAADHPSIAARCLWRLERNMPEPDYLQAVYDVLTAACSDSGARWACTLEYVLALQVRHIAARPLLPRDWSDSDQEAWSQRQAEAEAASPYLYPRFNPIFGPFPGGGREIFVSTRLSPASGHRVPALLAVTGVAARLAGEIRASDGRLPLGEICARADTTRRDYLELSRRLRGFEPYALDGYWLPESQWSWRPRFHPMGDGPQ